LTPKTKTRVYRGKHGSVYRAPGGGFICEFGNRTGRYDEAASFFTPSIVTAREEIDNYSRAVDRLERTKAEIDLRNRASRARDDCRRKPVKRTRKR
jgi:hypothetical protein